MATTWSLQPCCCEWDFTTTHHCKPLFHWREARDPPFVDITGRSEEDWSPVRAWDAERAAASAGEQYDQDGEYYLAQGNDMLIEVRSPGGEVTRWRVVGESVPIVHREDG